MAYFCDLVTALLPNEIELDIRKIVVILVW